MISASCFLRRLAAAVASGLLRRSAANAAAALAVAVGLGAGAALAAGQPVQGGIHTAGQAESGRAAYTRSCAICHRTDLRGNFEAPPLAGPNFLGFWGDLTPLELVERIRDTMPPDRPGRLGDRTYLDIVAYLLEANGAPAGDEPLTAATAVPIGDVATGDTAPAPAITAAAQGRARRPDTRTAAAAVPGGLTVAGEVESYTPVTDEMLRDPAPGDWLMVRRNYQAWSHSPLDAITRDNVGELELQWMWAMNEGGRNAPSPIAHGGVLYFAGFGPVVQALDARTGDLIWEHEVGVEAGQLASSSRNLAIYQDKLYLATADARLIALDARTGAEVWTSRIADDAEGFRNTSGPVIAGGTIVQGLGGCGQFTREGCFISGWDAATGERLWRFNTVARADEPGGNTWAELPDYLRGGGETWITGSYDPRARPRLLRRGAGEAVGRGQPGHDRPRPRPLHPARPSPCGRGTATSPGTSSTSPARASTSTRSSSGCWSMSAGGRPSSAPASTASSGSSTARPASSSATRRPSSRTSSTTSIPRPAPSPTARTSSTPSSSSSSPRVPAPPAARTGTR